MLKFCNFGKAARSWRSCIKSNLEWDDLLPLESDLFEKDDSDVLESKELKVPKAKSKSPAKRKKDETKAILIQKKEINNALMDEQKQNLEEKSLEILKNIKEDSKPPSMEMEKSTNLKKKVQIKKLTAKKSKVKSKVLAAIELVKQVEKFGLPNNLQQCIRNSKLITFNLTKSDRKACYSFFEGLKKEQIALIFLSFPQTAVEMAFVKENLLTKQFIDMLFRDFEIESIL